MEPIEIKITPRKLERAVLLAVIAVLLVSLYYYGYMGCPAGTEPSTSANATASTSAPSSPAPVTPVQQPPVATETVTQPTPSTTSGASDGKIAVSIADLKYVTKQVNDKQTFRVESFDITIRNGKDTTQTGITVDVYHYDANMETEEVNLYLTKAENGDPFPIEPITAGATISRTVPIKTPKSIWEKGVVNTYKFVIKQKGQKIEEIVKTVKV